MNLNVRSNRDVTSEVDDVWGKDKLGYREVGASFTSLIQSIDTDKVISIEAGFGRGKTFFRKAWAQQLRSEGEVVVEVDVQRSDHSGDPVITVLGALIEAMPNSTDAQARKVLDTAKKIGAVGSRAVLRAVLKSGADEVLDCVTDKAIDSLEDFDAFDKLIKDVGGEMSKMASQLISSQIAAERVRKEEIPAQLDLLRNALGSGPINQLEGSRAA
jgi:hypothetical protein